MPKGDCDQKTTFAFGCLSGASTHSQSSLANTTSGARREAKGECMTDLVEQARAGASILRAGPAIPIRVYQDAKGRVIWSKVGPQNRDLQPSEGDGFLYHVRSLFVPHGADSPLDEITRLTAALEGSEAAITILNAQTERLVAALEKAAGDAAAGWKFREDAVAENKALRAVAEKMAGALETILGESRRENVQLCHLKRCTFAQANPALIEWKGLTDGE
jgi:hypothetical protein